MNKGTRQAVLSILHHSGFMRLWQLARREIVTILCFHDVGDDGEQNTWKPLRPRLLVQDFERYIRLLTRSFRVLPLEHAIEALAGKRRLQAGSVVLTFDDGYANNATHAWPILRGYDVPATFFVSTGYLGTNRAFWLDRLDYALQHLEHDCDSIEVADRRFPVPNGDRESLAKLFWDVKDACSDDGWAQGEQAIGRIEEQTTSSLQDVAENDHWAGFMQWDDVRRMQAQGATFGSHTVNHLMFDELSEEEAWQELVDSKTMLESQTGQPCNTLAYPNGRFTEKTVKLAQQAGYWGAVTMSEGSSTPRSDVMLLPRVGPPRHPISDSDLAARASGLSTAMSVLPKWKPSTTNRLHQGTWSK